MKNKEIQLLKVRAQIYRVGPLFYFQIYITQRKSRLSSPGYEGQTLHKMNLLASTIQLTLMLETSCLGVVPKTNLS